MTKTKRRLLAVVCIALLVVTATSSAGFDLCAVLVYLGPLFGTVIVSPTPEPNLVSLGNPPARSVRASRAPPLA
jgi:hypothetical protein